jgi:uncharacterized protein YlxW (UPF0749 family)
MPKKKGLGTHVNKSMEIMDETVSVLKEFAHMPLKKGLEANNANEDDLTKMVNQAQEKAFALINSIDDIRNKVRKVKTVKSERFAKIVVAKFLEEQDQ